MTGSSTPRLHAAIISWQGYGAAAQEMAKQVAPCVDSLSVIYSNASGAAESGAGTWISVHNSAFFGAKFRKAIELHDGDIFLLLHADTAFSDWPALIDRCRGLFRDHASLGLWSPDFTHTSFPTEFVRIGKGPRDGLCSVANPDAIILAMREEVVGRLLELDYSENNLGWGISWTAVAYCLTHNLLVCRDRDFLVSHERSRGYRSEEAGMQRDAFLTQLTLQEQNQVELLRTFIASRAPRIPFHIKTIRRIKRRLGR